MVKRGETKLDPVVFTVNRNHSVGVPVTQTKRLEVCHLIHVFGIVHSLKLLHPMFNGLAVSLLDGREIRLGPLDLFFTHANRIMG